LVESATVTTPVAALMVKPPPEVSPVSAQVTAGPLTSVDDAVTPTIEPLAAPSAIVLVAASLSIGVEGATSETAIVKVCELMEVPSLACAVTV
jgi:hypothetical protein